MAAAEIPSNQNTSLCHKFEEKTLEMSNYSLAVDIGGTFTDVVLRSACRPLLGRQDADHAENLEIGFFRAFDAVLTSRASRPAR